MNPFEVYRPTWEHPPGRPWWRKLPTGTWIRTDGAAFQVHLRGGGGYHIQVPNAGIDEVFPWKVTGKQIHEHIDEKWPMPLPTLAANQVWAGPDGEVSILAVARFNGTAVAVVIQPAQDGSPALTVIGAESFGERVLVDGKGSPWAPLGWTPEAFEVTADEEVFDLGIELEEKP